MTVKTTWSALVLIEIFFFFLIFPSEICLFEGGRGGGGGGVCLEFYCILFWVVISSNYQRIAPMLMLRLFLRPILTQLSPTLHFSQSVLGRS